MSQNLYKPLGMMSDWPNHDLCLEDATLKHLQDTFPRIAPIFDASDCQRRSKTLPDGGVKVGHLAGEPFAVAGGVKLVQFVVS